MSLTVTLPSGVKHPSTTAFAESWEAWDRIKARFADEPGWEVGRRFDSRTGEANEWLRGKIDGLEVVLHEPLTPRQTPREVSDVPAVPPANERAA